MNATLLRVDGASPPDETLTRFFAQCGFRVEIARNRTEWLTKARLLEPDLVVVDLDAGERGEDAVAAYSPDVRRGFELPTVFVLGTASAEALSERTGVPAESCFQKPVPTEILLDHIGLIVALMDLLRRTGELRPRRLPLNRPHERPKRRATPQVTMRHAVV